MIPSTRNANFPVPATAFDPVKAMRSGAYFRLQRRGSALEPRRLLPKTHVP